MYKPNIPANEVLCLLAYEKGYEDREKRICQEDGAVQEGWPTK